MKNMELRVREDERLNRSVYRKVARDYGVSTAEVKREIRKAIEAAYANHNAEALAVPRKGMVPQSSELINYCAGVIKGII